MLDLTRDQFCGLTSLRPEGLQALYRRDQLPFEVNQKVHGRGYTLFEAFLTTMSVQLVTDYTMNATRASSIVAGLPDLLTPLWPELRRTAERRFEGHRAGPDDILCGFSPNQVGPLCATREQVSADLQAGRLNSVVLIDASSTLYGMLLRADRRLIAIPDEFWSAPFKYRARLRVDARENMRKLLASEEGQRLLAEDEEA